MRAMFAFSLERAVSGTRTRYKAQSYNDDCLKYRSAYYYKAETIEASRIAIKLIFK